MSGAVIPLTLQWALNETADGFYKISKDIVHAATKDNVQATTLDAMDKFGTTLAICPETEYHVEKILQLARGSRLVEFMKSHVGFAKGDSCDALSSSTGGIRLLALAATLVTWDSFEAAKAIREMMYVTSKSLLILPTFGSLETTIKSLEYKTHRLGFADKVMQ